MPERNFKGLPTVKKFVARLTKTGKLQSYYQRYHVNPFKRDRVPSDARKGKSIITDNELANNYGKALKFGVKSDKGLMFKDQVSTLRVANGTIGGPYTITKILDKIKSVDDAKTFVSEVFKPIADKVLNDSEIGNNITLNKEMGMFFNNVESKPDVYNVYINGIKDSAHNMSDTAIGTTLASFSDYNVVNQVVADNVKSETYSFDNMRHDLFILSRNPLFHIMNYCNYDVYENIKHFITSLNNQNNNLKYLNNNIAFDDKTKEIQSKFVERLSDMVNSNKKLYLHTFIELNVDVAVMLYKEKLSITLPFMFSPILELYDGDDILGDNFKEIKDANVDNMLPINLVKSKFVMDNNSKTVFLYCVHETNLSNKNVVYVPDSNVINDISKDIEGQISDDGFSTKYIKDKNEYILNNIDNNIKNKYLILNWMV